MFPVGAPQPLFSPSKYCPRHPENKYTRILLSACRAQICASFPQQMMDSGQDQFSKGQGSGAIPQMSLMSVCFLLSAQQFKDIDLHLLWSDEVKWQQEQINLFFPDTGDGSAKLGVFFFFSPEIKKMIFFTFQTQNLH